MCCGLVRVEVTGREEFQVRSGEGRDDRECEVGSYQVYKRVQEVLGYKRVTKFLVRPL